MKYVNRPLVQTIEHLADSHLNSHDNFVEIPALFGDCGRWDGRIRSTEERTVV